MGRSSQRKGRGGELELRDRLKEYGYDVRCGAPQSFGDVPDLVGLPGIHIEVKRCEQIRLTEWMQQATRDAERFGDGAPAVFHRRNRQPWMVTLLLTDFMRMYQTAAECGAVTSGGAGEYETHLRAETQPRGCRGH